MLKFICLFVDEFICKERQNSKKKIEIFTRNLKHLALNTTSQQYNSFTSKLINFSTYKLPNS